MGGNALIASAQHGVWAVIALQRRAARAGRAFVARFGGIVEVEAAGSLQEIATGGGYIVRSWVDAPLNKARLSTA